MPYWGDMLKIILLIIFAFFWSVLFAGGLILVLGCNCGKEKKYKRGYDENKR